MTAFHKILFIALTVFLGEKLMAGAIIATGDTSINLYESEKKNLLARINFEKSRIASDYHTADQRLFILVDSLTAFILDQPVNDEKRNTYLGRLQSFLSNINRYYSSSYFKSGVYLADLSYFPDMVEWDQKGVLLSNLDHYRDFSVKACRLIPNDSIAEIFLMDYTYAHPDDVFRYADEFDDRSFAIRLLEKAVRKAPESAKRYYSSSNTVYDLLRQSRDLYVKKSLEIYDNFGLKSRAYLLLPSVVSGGMSIKGSDSIGYSQDQMFRLLVSLSAKNDESANYSTYRYLDNYASEFLRKMTQEAIDEKSEQSPLRHLSTDELFVILAYGYRDVLFSNFQKMLEVLVHKNLEAPLDSRMVETMDKQKLRNFILYCENNGIINILLPMLEMGTRNYVVALSKTEEKESAMPPFKSFAKGQKENVKAVEVQRAPKDGGKNEPAKATATEAPSVATVPVKQKNKNQKIGTARALPAIDTTAGLNEPTQADALDYTTVERTDMVPLPPTEVVEPIRISLDEKSKAVISLKKNVVQTIHNIPAFINKDYAEEILLYAAKKEPDELFKKIDFFKGKVYCKKVLEECALNAPMSVKRYLYNPMLPVNYILHYSDNPVVKKIIEITPHLGNYSKPLLLLDDIYNGKTTLKEAIVISNDPNKLFSAIVKIISKPNYIGHYNIDREMRDYSLHFVREINDKIASGASQPFNAVEGFSATDLYFLMLYGRDEVFTSTFNGLFNRFMQKLPKNDGEAFLNGINHNQFRDFISLCSNYGTVEDFLSRFSGDQKDKLLSAYISHLENDKDELASIVLIAEAVSNLPDNQLLAILQGDIKEEFERVKASNDQIGLSIYGVLSSMVSGTAKVDAAWFRRVAQQFRIAPASTLSSASLFNDNAQCIEQMYFYNDEDGRSSYVNFINTYHNQAAWIIEDHNSFVRVYSHSGQHIEVLANKPERQEEGISDIANYMKLKNITASVIAHRGHSFHTEATLEKITGSAKLIFLGSCGGFYKISMALENAPEAHIISTKQVGTKTINDIMLFALNENIRAGRDVEWNEFWDRMRDKLGSNPYFSDYVPPHKNLEAIFFRAYYKTLGV